MAIFHMSVKVIQRSKGRSAVAAAAYRASEKITDERTGQEYDYTRKGKPVGTPVIITPDGSKISRAELWNMAEQSEKRKDATTAREYELALPCELTTEQRESLAKEFCHYLAQKNGCAVDMAIHKPSGKDGDERNFHAHILTTTRIFENGTLGKKCDLELSDRDRKAKGLDGRKNELLAAREAWANFVNRALEKAGHEIRVDHRTLEAQGIDRLPTKHLGPTATAIVREERHKKKGRRSDRADEQHERANERKEKITEYENDIAAIKSEIDALKKEIAIEAEEEKRTQEKIAAAKLAEEEKAKNEGAELVPLISEKQSLVARLEEEMRIAYSKISGAEYLVKKAKDAFDEHAATKNNFAFWRANAFNAKVDELAKEWEKCDEELTRRKNVYEEKKQNLRREQNKLQDLKDRYEKSPHAKEQKRLQELEKERKQRDREIQRQKIAPTISRGMGFSR